MPDSELYRLLVDLADAIRDVPAGDVHQALVDRFFVVVKHLEGKEQIERAGWELKSRAG
jgi:hypothetical protein